MRRYSPTFTCHPRGQVPLGSDHVNLMQNANSNLWRSSSYDRPVRISLGDSTSAWPVCGSGRSAPVMEGAPGNNEPQGRSLIAVR